ncbi:MAG TPA: type II toxin-antitoxin system PemK/MazF family toxin [Verrucomicrobiae bacterium]|nr:type II toxin-antitoxin system PemK/MazF family toxin [Verrucomicrobiae bacterium]
MGQLAIGTVVLINFPFADLRGYKKRPAMVVARSSLNTVILCQITSRRLPDVPSIELTKADFESGGLPITSYIRPDKLFTVDSSTAEKKLLGMMSAGRVEEVKTTARKLFE